MAEYKLATGRLSDMYVENARKWVKSAPEYIDSQAGSWPSWCAVAEFMANQDGYTLYPNDPNRPRVDKDAGT
jgi:hypothetical protein